MIYDVTQRGSIRAAQGKTSILSLCREVGIPASTYEGDMVALDIGDKEALLVYRGDWLVVNITTETVDVLDDELFQEEFWVMN